MSKHTPPEADWVPLLCRIRDCGQELTRGFITARICRDCVIRKMPSYARDQLPYLSETQRKQRIREWRDALSESSLDEL